MKFVSVVLFLAALQAAGAWADEFEQEIERKKILAGYELTLDEIQQAFQNWLTDPTSDYHVQRNFTEMKAQHAAFLSKVVGLANQQIPTAASLDELQKLILENESQFEAFTNEHFDILHQDRRFVYSLETIEGALIKRQKELDEHLLQIPERLKPQATNIQANLKKWQDSLQHLRGYIALAGQKRSRFVRLVFKTRKLRLEEAYARSLNQTVEQLRSSIHAAYKGEELLKDFNRWWHKTFVLNGAGGKERIRFLQWEEPLRIFRVQLVEAQTYLQRLAAIEGLTDDSRSFIKDIMDKKVQSLQSVFEKHQQKGWQGLHQDQAETVGFIIEDASEYGPVCLELAGQFQKQFQNVSDLTMYRQSEILFKKIIVACDGEEP